MIVAELDKKKITLMKKVFLTTAIYAQVAHSPETRELVGEISLVDLAKALGIKDHKALRVPAHMFDGMLDELDWKFSVEKKDGQLSWRFCNCGKEGCQGHDL
jgi:hypothetical protein